MEPAHTPCMAPLNIWLPQKLGLPYGRSTEVRLVFCGIAAWLNGIDLALQGNNWIWIGFNIGLVLGFAWSALLLFGLTPLMRNFRPSAKAALWGVSLSAGLALLAIICFQIWGQ